MKKKLLIGICLVIGLGVLIVNNPGSISEEEPIPEKDGDYERDEVVVEIDGLLSFRGERFDSGTLVLVDGRLFVPWEETDAWIGSLTGEAVSADEEIEEIKIIKGSLYIRINEFCEQWNLWPVFSDEGVELHRYETKWENDERSGESGEGSRIACLRLEDIMADPTEDSRFTHEKLEKMRVLVRWLSDRGQEFSIAWIPVYTNPTEGIVNDLTKTYNWYNADFLYTLDVMVQCGGHVGVHGLTHQYGNDVSADGWEFGKDSPFTLAEAEARMTEAKAVAEALGYEVEFFEFPHYGMTKEQGKLAERHFDVIYQQEPWTKPYGSVETKRIGNRTVMYVPTPADCVQSEYDFEGILQRMAVSREAGQLVSLFFHPSLDYDKIHCREGGERIRVLGYEENRGILSGIVSRIEEWNMQFGVVW